MAAVTALDLPLSAESLLLLSRGSNSAGNVEIVTSSEQEQDVATVEVVVSYLQEDARDDAKVCQILSKDGGIGVGIFVSRNDDDDDQRHIQLKKKTFVTYRLVNGRFSQETGCILQPK